MIAALGQAFALEGQELALVGGVVRDLLLGETAPDDLDLTTSAPPEVTRRAGAAAGAVSTYDIGEKFGTIGLVFRPDSEAEPIVAEVTTYRTEHYRTNRVIRRFSSAAISMAILPGAISRSMRSQPMPSPVS